MIAEGTDNIETAPASTAVGEGASSVRQRKPGRKRRALKLSALIVFVPVAVFLLVAVILIYLYQGQRISGESINKQVQTAIQSFIGDAYRVEIGDTGLALISSSLLSLQGNDVRIIESESNAVIATLNEVEVGLDPLSLFADSFRFSDILIEKGSVDLSAIKAGGGAPGLSENLSLIARQVDQASKPFAGGMIEQITARNISVAGLDLGRKSANEPLLVESLIIEGTPENGVTVNAATRTRLSNPVISARWTPAIDNAKGELTAGVGPVNSLEFFSHADPLMALTEESPDGVGLQTRFRADIRISYTAAYKPEQPFIKIQAEGGELRVGNNQTTSLNHLIANVRADFDRELLIMEQGDISLGPITFRASGLLKLQGAEDQHGVLPLNLSLVDFVSTDPLWNPQAGLDAVVLDGAFTPETRRLDVNGLRLSDKAGSSLEASGRAVFPPNASPAITATVKSPQMTIGFLQNAWPFNIAPPVRNWIREEVSGGTVNDFQVQLDVREGRFGEIDNGGGFTDGEFTLFADLEGISVPTTGELPPVSDLSGTLRITDRALVFENAEGSMERDGGEKVAVNNGAMKIANIFATPPVADISVTLSAPLPGLAMMASARPLDIPARIGIDPAALSGEVEVQIKLSVPLVEKPDPDALIWSAKVDLKNGASKAPVFGQTIKGANVTINAEPKLVRTQGTANINGFDAKLDVSEPINGGASKNRARTILTRLTTKQLASQGIDLDPVVSGTLGVQIKSGADSQDHYEIDLTNADLSLPWISWTKGSGIASKATFVLEQKGDTNTLRDFSVSGPTYQASGTLSFNKAGLIAATLSNVVLVRGDKFNITVQRKSGRYFINANGPAFDGRAIINKVIHGDGFDEASESSDVSLNANFGRISGFNQQVMENALVRYETESGKLSLLQVRGAIGGGLSTIDAGSNGNQTSFTFASRNAGGALAIVDLYRKMEGGRLESKLVRTGNGPFKGDVKFEKFTVVGEERLKSLVAAPPENNRLQRASGRLKELDVQRVRFDDMEAKIEKGEDLLIVRDGRIRNQQIGLTFDGTLFDPSDQMSVRGTFMPLFAVSRLIGGIPIIGDILSNGKNSGLIGITYRLKGSSGNPQMLVNPISIIAPGIFRQIFQFQE